MTTLADKINETSICNHVELPSRKITAMAGELIKGVPRFVCDADVHDSVRDLLTTRPTTLLGAIRFARPPFERMWVEWPTPDMPEPLHMVRVRTKRIGAFIETLPGSNGMA